MLTIMPGLDVLKAVTDTNIDSPGAAVRRQAFDSANDLLSRHCDAEILIDGNMFGRVTVRLNEDQITFFREAYRIDNSATGLTGFNHTGGMKFVAHREQRLRRVIILTDNTTAFASITGQRIVAATPANFLRAVERALMAYERGLVTVLADALAIEFFL